MYGLYLVIYQQHKMQNFLYNIETGKREGPIREGHYTVDGIRVNVTHPLVELEIVTRESPPYDNTTQTIDYQEFVDISNLQFVKGYVVRNLTQEEINQNNQPYPVPQTCTPRQFRLSLLDYGIDPDYITSFIQQMPNQTESKRIMIIWEYANSFERNDPLISQFASLLSVSEEIVDNIFRQAVTYT